MKRRFVSFLFVALTAYVISYLYLTKDGVYEPDGLGAKRSSEGHIFRTKGFGLVWQPFGSKWIPATGSDDLEFKEMIYAPLIWGDRKIWHTNRAELLLP